MVFSSSFFYVAVLYLRWNFCSPQLKGIFFRGKEHLFSLLGENLLSEWKSWLFFISLGVILPQLEIGGVSGYLIGNQTYYTKVQKYFFLNGGCHSPEWMDIKLFLGRKYIYIYKIFQKIWKSGVNISRRTKTLPLVWHLVKYVFLHIVFPCANCIFEKENFAYLFFFISNLL